MKRYKFFYIKETGYHNNNPLFSVINNKSNSPLGEIYYYRPWRKFIFEPRERIIFDVSCMEKIIAFIENEIDS